MYKYIFSEGFFPHTNLQYFHVHFWLKQNLFYILLILVLTFSVECLSLPSIPEVVYPYKNKSAISVFTAQSTITTAEPFIERDVKLANNISETRHSVSNTVNNFRLALQNRNRTHASAHRNLNIPTSGSTNKNTSSSETTSSAETRVILSPINEMRVYTADKYFLVSSERVDVDGEANPRDTKKMSPEVTMHLGFQNKKHDQEVIGKAAISELGPEEMQRTTMHESISRTTTTSPVRSIFSLSNPHTALRKSSKSAKVADQTSSLSALQLVSHDTASGRVEQSMRFPAQRWQLPPSLYSTRLKSVEHSQLLNPVINASITSYPQGTFLRQMPKSDEILILPGPPVKSSVREGIDIPFHDASSLKNSHPLPQGSIPSPSLYQSFSADLSASKPLVRPNLRLTGGGVQSPKNVLRAKFASRHTDNLKKPIALPTSTDDSDFDLLSPPKTKSAINTFIPLPISVNANKLIAETNPIQPTDVNSIRYVARINPNEKLHLCCKKQSVSSHCQGLCNFDTFTDRSLVGALLSNQCPGPQLGQAFDCATSKVDHSECCRKFNIHLHNGGQCMAFCETHLPTPPNVLSYVACLPVFENIKSCYRDHQINNPNIYGD